MSLSISIKRDAHVDTFSYSGPIGVVLLSGGLPKTDYYSVEFHEDMGEVRLDSIYNEETGELVWDGAEVPEGDWTEKDDLIVEACEGYAINNWDGR